MKIKKLICLIMVIITVLGCSGCGCVNIKPKTFEDKCKTSADGFVYYVDRSIGLCIIELPKTEEVVIPEYIDGIKVAQLGYEEIGIMYSETHVVDGSHVKKLTIKTPLIIVGAIFDLESLVYYDYFVNTIDHKKLNFSFCEIITIQKGIGYNYPNNNINTKVYLKYSGKSIDCSQLDITEIKIPKYVVEIDLGVFNQISDITIKTSYSEKPSGWAEGWNGNNQVLWGCQDVVENNSFDQFYQYY